MSKRELKRYTTRAMKLEEGSVPEAVFVPPAMRGRLVQTQYVTNGKPIRLEQHIVRIQDEADPVGMLIAVAMGQPIPTTTINDDGEAITKFETLPLKDRIPVMKFLSDKVLPRMSVNKKIEPGKDDAWEATLENAGSDG